MVIRKFLLTSFDYLRPKDPNISLASSSILALLKAHFQPNCKTPLELYHRQYNVKNADFENLMAIALNDIKDIKPDIIATGVYVWNEAFITPLFENLHKSKYRPAYIIYGGPQITYSTKGTLEKHYPFTDFFVRGYGEESLLKLLKCIQHNETDKIRNIDGIHIKSVEDKGVQSQYQLSTLPSPLLTPGLVQHNGFIRWETKRGCPFECAFCQHKDSYKHRLQCTQQRISQEQKWMVTNNISDISVVDPIFNSGGSDYYLAHLIGFLDNKYKGRLNMQARFEMITPEFLSMCSRLMENEVQVELEFGIQTIIKKESIIIKRMNNLKKVAAASNELRARNIPFEVSLIYGLPEQTLDSFQSSLDWVRTFVIPSRVRAWPLMLLRGTPLYDAKTKYNMREKMLDENLEELDKTRQYKGIPHVIESSSFSEATWDKMKSLAISINNEG